MVKVPFYIKPQSMACLLAAALMCTLLLCGCSGGGGGATVTAPPGSTAATSGLLKVGTVGGTTTDLIAGMDLQVNLPAGVTVDADPSSGETTTGAVTLSGAAAGGNSLVVAKYAPAAAGTSATLHIAVLNASGLHPGEFVTVRFNLAAGTSFPALNAFTMASFSAKRPDSSALSVITASPLSVAAVGKAAATKQAQSQVVFTGTLNSTFMNIVADTPTRNSSQTITGTCKWEPGYHLTITPTNTATTVSVPVISSNGTWSAQVSGLVEGKNSITVIDTDALGAVVGSVSATIILDTKSPDLSFASATYSSKKSVTSIGGGVGDPLNPDVALLSVDCPTATVEMATFAVPYWSAIISNLTYGDNTCHVTATDLAGNHVNKDVHIYYDNLVPDLNIYFNALVKYGIDQSISGTVESGIKPVMTVNGVAYAGTMTVNGSNWSCQVGGLAEGANTITVTATDAAGNVATRTATITTVVANGSFSGLSQPRIEDALKALRIAIGFDQPTAAELLHGDLFDDGKIDVSDAILILKKVVGL